MTAELRVNVKKPGTKVKHLSSFLTFLQTRTGAVAGPAHGSCHPLAVLGPPLPKREGRLMKKPGGIPPGFFTSLTQARRHT